MIRTFDDPILHQICHPVDIFVERKVNKIIRDMKQTLNRHKNGVGIAAPQVGHPWRIAIIRAPNQPDLVLINPGIVSHSPDRISGDEGCLSFPGVVAKNILRYREITIQFTNHKFLPEQRTFTEFPARIVQHELDHLNGICQVGDAWRNSIPKTSPSTSSQITEPSTTQ